jgi:phosphoribosylformylglycinamidine (FGAM) synthase-like enzyme
MSGAPGGLVPGPAAQAAPLYRALHAAMRAGEVRACHDLSEGGLAVAAAEMCIGGRLGMRLELQRESLLTDPSTALFSESNGRLLAEVSPEQAASFEARFAGLPLARLGLVTAEPRLIIGSQITLKVAELCAAWLPGDEA